MSQSCQSRTATSNSSRQKATFMTTEEARVIEPNWVSYIDTLKTAGAVKRSREPEIAAAPSAKEERDIPDEPKNWAEFIDRIYIQELMRSLDH